MVTLLMFPILEFTLGIEKPKYQTSLSNIRKVTIKMILDKLRITVSGGGA